MIEGLTLTKTHLRLLNALLVEADEEEGVAILFGAPDEDPQHWVIEPLFNEAAAHEAHKRCEVTIEQLQPVLERQRAAGRDIQAWWHSHPSGAAIPSETDHANDEVPLMLISSGATLKYESQRHRAWWVEPGERAAEVPMGFGSPS